MTETIRNCYDNVFLEGSKWTCPLKATLEAIDQTTLHKVAKIFLSFLAYLVFGVPAIIGVGINYHLISTSSAETEASNPSLPTDVICQTLKTQLERLQPLFNADLDEDGDVTHSIVLGHTPDNTYEQDKHLEVFIFRALSEDEIAQIVGYARKLAEHGLFIDRFDMRVVNLPSSQVTAKHATLIHHLNESGAPLPGEQTAMKYGLLLNRFQLRRAALPNDRLTCASIKFMIPDQFDLRGDHSQTICYS